jgi:prephenate dehydrogenase
MTIGVVGLGLIGGSIGLALRDSDRSVVGYDPDPANAKLAKDRMCVDELQSLEDVAQADVVFVAAPPSHVVEVLGKLRDAKRPETILTDCASVKRPVAAWAEETGEKRFVPGHPMAGHEKSGPGFASPWMFRHARWVLSPLPTTDSKAVSSVEKLVKEMGAVPVRIPPDRHDRHVAIVSHLPHAIAGALVAMADSLEDEEVSGGSWRDLTRVGGVDPGLWSQIFLGNRVELSQVLSDMSRQLSKLSEDLAREDANAVVEFLAVAQRAKARQDARAPGVSPSALTKTGRLKGKR